MEMEMKLLDLFKTGRSTRKPRRIRASDPFAGFTARDWADLPAFHPVSDK
jgi:hypothetical protein